MAKTNNETQVAMGPAAKELLKQGAVQGVIEAGKYFLHDRTDGEKKEFDSLESAKKTLAELESNGYYDYEIIDSAGNAVREQPEAASLKEPDWADLENTKSSAELARIKKDYENAKAAEKNLAFLKNEYPTLSALGPQVASAAADYAAGKGSLKSMGLAAINGGLDFPGRVIGGLIDKGLGNSSFKESAVQTYGESGSLPGSNEERNLGGKMAQGFLRDPTTLPIALATMGTSLIPQTIKGVGIATKAAPPVVQKMLAGTVTGAGLGAASGTARPLIEGKDLEAGKVGEEAALGAALGLSGGLVGRFLERTGLKSMSKPHHEALTKELENKTGISSEVYKEASKPGRLEQIKSAVDTESDIADKLLKRKYLTDADMPEAKIVNEFIEAADGKIPKEQIEAIVERMEKWGADRLRERGMSESALLKGEEAVEKNLNRQAQAFKNPNAGTTVEQSSLINPATGKPYEKVTIVEPFKDLSIKDFNKFRQDVGGEIANNKGWSRNQEGYSADYMDTMQDVYHGMKQALHGEMKKILPPQDFAKYEQAYNAVAKKLKVNEKLWEQVGAGKDKGRMQERTEKKIKNVKPFNDKNSAELKKAIDEYDKTFGTSFGKSITDAGYARQLFDTRSGTYKGVPIKTGFSNSFIPNWLSGRDVASALRIAKGAYPATDEPYKLGLAGLLFSKDAADRIMNKNPSVIGAKYGAK